MTGLGIPVIAWKAEQVEKKSLSMYPRITNLCQIHNLLKYSQNMTPDCQLYDLLVR